MRQKSYVAWVQHKIFCCQIIIVLHRMNQLIDGGDEVTNAIEELFERLDHIKHMRE